MMKAFKKRGALTHFQILSEISKQDPHLKQKDLANKLGITIQAVSENIKTLIELGYITSKDGRSPYKITQAGIDKVKKDAISLRKYSDSVLETMNHYKTIWPAIATEELKKDINAEIELMNNLNLSAYIIIEKKLIKYPQSYDLFLEELIENKIYKEEELTEEKKKMKENNTINLNNTKDKCKSIDLKEYHSVKEIDIKTKNENIKIENLENLENLE